MTARSPTVGTTRAFSRLRLMCASRPAWAAETDGERLRTRNGAAARPRFVSPLEEPPGECQRPRRIEALLLFEVAPAASGRSSVATELSETDAWLIDHSFSVDCFTSPPATAGRRPVYSRLILGTSTPRQRVEPVLCGVTGSSSGLGGNAAPPLPHLAPRQAGTHAASSTTHTAGRSGSSSRFPMTRRRRLSKWISCPAASQERPR
jgi:hypothetical protein